MSYNKWVLISAFLFGAGILFGILVPANVSGSLSEELTVLEELASLFAPFQILTCVFIFLKNASAILFSFFLSPILCLIPILSLMFNGCILGLVSSAVAQEESLGIVLAAILPHGIFEIPALILGEAAAFSFGTAAMLALFSRRRKSQMGAAFGSGLRRLLLAIILLIPAAIIETYVTPLLMDGLG